MNDFVSRAGSGNAPTNTDTPEELRAHLREEDEVAIPYLRQAAQRAKGAARKDIDESIGRILSDHERYYSLLRQGFMPDAGDIAKHAAFEDAVVKRYRGTLIALLDGGAVVVSGRRASSASALIESSASSFLSRRPIYAPRFALHATRLPRTGRAGTGDDKFRLMTAVELDQQARARADDALAAVLHTWDDYKRSSYGSTNVDGIELAGKPPYGPAPGIAGQIDPLIAAVKGVRAFDDRQAGELEAFNRIADYFFGRGGGDWLRKVENYAKSLGGTDFHYDDESIAQARKAIDKYIRRGWPLWPFWSERSARGASPYQLWKGFEAHDAANMDITTERQEALRNLWVLFLANAEDSDIRFAALYGYHGAGSFEPMIVDSGATSSLPDATPDTWWRSPAASSRAVAYATIAAKAYGAPLEATRKAVLLRVLRDVVQQDPAEWKKPYATIVSKLAGVPVGGPVYSGIGGLLPLAQVDGETAKIALEEAQARKGEDRSVSTGTLVGLGAAAAIAAVVTAAVML